MSIKRKKSRWDNPELVAVNESRSEQIPQEEIAKIESWFVENISSHFEFTDNEK